MGYKMDILVYDAENLVPVMKRALSVTDVPFDILENEWTHTGIFLEYSKDRLAHLVLEVLDGKAGKKLRDELGVELVYRGQTVKNASRFSVKEMAKPKPKPKPKKSYAYAKTGTVVGHGRGYPGL